jgi:hypothetical protein
LEVAQDGWSTKAHAYYRKWLYGEGTVREDSQRKGYSQDQVEVAQAAVENFLFLPMLEIRKRMKVFSEGIALGSEDYVKGMAARYQAQFERQKERSPKPLKTASGEKSGSIFVMRVSSDRE